MQNKVYRTERRRDDVASTRCRQGVRRHSGARVSVGRSAALFPPLPRQASKQVRSCRVGATADVCRCSAGQRSASRAPASASPSQSRASCARRSALPPSKAALSWSSIQDCSEETRRLAARVWYTRPPRCIASACSNACAGGARQAGPSTAQSNASRCRAPCGKTRHQLLHEALVGARERAHGVHHRQRRLDAKRLVRARRGKLKTRRRGAPAA